MFDFKKIRISPLTKEWILERVSDSEVFMHYYGKFQLNKQCKDAFSKDNNPSATFFIGQSGEIVYHSFKSNESYNCFSFVRRLYQCNYDRALTIIAETFGLILLSYVLKLESLIELLRKMYLFSSLKVNGSRFLVLHSLIGLIMIILRRNS